MAGSYMLSGCKANSLSKLNWLNYIKDNLHFSTTTRLGKMWGNYCYIGIDNPTAANLASYSVYISERNDDHLFKCIYSNKYWMIVEAKSSNLKKITDLLLSDNPIVYYDDPDPLFSLELNIRPIMPTDNYKFLNVYLKPQGVFGKVFDNLTFIISTNNEMKIVGVTDSDLERINSGLLDLNGVIYDLSNDTNDIVIEGLKYTGLLDLGNCKALIFEFPVNGERKNLYITSESTSKYEYLIVPDIDIENLKYSFSNDELPPPVSEFLINDNFVTESMFYTDFDKNLMLYQNKITHTSDPATSQIFFCRKAEDYDVTQIGDISNKLNNVVTVDFDEARMLNCDSLMLLFSMPRLSCEAEINSISEAIDTSEGKAYLCSATFDVVGNQNKVVIYDNANNPIYHIPTEVMFIYNKDVYGAPSVPTPLVYVEGTWVTATEENNVNYYRQLSIVNINNSEYSLLYLTNLPKFRITEDSVEVLIVI